MGSALRAAWSRTIGALVCVLERLRLVERIPARDRFVPGVSLAARRICSEASDAGAGTPHMQQQAFAPAQPAPREAHS